MIRSNPSCLLTRLRSSRESGGGGRRRTTLPDWAGKMARETYGFGRPHEIRTRPWNPRYTPRTPSPHPDTSAREFSNQAEQGEVPGNDNASDDHTQEKDDHRFHRREQ